MGMTEKEQEEWRAWERSMQRDNDSESVLEKIEAFETIASQPIIPDKLQPGRLDEEEAFKEKIDDWWHKFITGSDPAGEEFLRKQEHAMWFGKPGEYAIAVDPVDQKVPDGTEIQYLSTVGIALINRSKTP